MSRGDNAVTRRINNMLSGDVTLDAKAELQKIRTSMTGGFKLALKIMTPQLQLDMMTLYHCSNNLWDWYTTQVTKVLTPIQGVRWEFNEMADGRWGECARTQLIDSLVVRSPDKVVWIFNRFVHSSRRARSCFNAYMYKSIYTCEEMNTSCPKVARAVPKKEQWYGVVVGKLMS